MKNKKGEKKKKKKREKRQHKGFVDQRTSEDSLSAEKSRTRQRNFEKQGTLCTRIVITKMRFSESRQNALNKASQNV